MDHIMHQLVVTIGDNCTDMVGTLTIRSSVQLRTGSEIVFLIRLKLCACHILFG